MAISSLKACNICVWLIFIFISYLGLLASGGELTKTIGGRDAYRGEFPASVWVRGVCRCGGTLLSLDAVLSVAHCFVKNGELLHPNTFMVVGGVVNRSEDIEEEQRSYVRDYIVHENFDVMKNEFGYYTIFDVAVVYLESAFVQTPTVKSAVFPASTSLGMLHFLKFIETTGDSCISLGFGLLAKGDSDDEVADTLRVGDLRLLPENDCIFEPMHGSEICATSIEGPVTSVPGDSGSTFMCGGYIIGMTKSSLMCHKNGKNITMLAYTLISSYIDYFDLNLMTEGASNSRLHPAITTLLVLQLMRLTRFLFR